MGLYDLACAAGPTLGPIVAGFAVVANGWRWAFWEMLWITGFALALLSFSMPEVSLSSSLAYSFLPASFSLLLPSLVTELYCRVILILSRSTGEVGTSLRSYDGVIHNFLHQMIPATINPIPTIIKLLNPTGPNQPPSELKLTQDIPRKHPPPPSRSTSPPNRKPAYQIPSRTPFSHFRLQRPGVIDHGSDLQTYSNDF
jgi:hypothetical protein